MEEDIEIELLQNKFKEIEIFEPITGLSKEKSRQWNKIKNMIFSLANFHQERESIWIKQYDIMLKNLSKNPKFQEYIPYTSHFCLLFSHKEYILPKYFINPTQEGIFYISERLGFDASMNGDSPEVYGIFNTIDEAMDFYHDLLEKSKIKRE